MADAGQQPTATPHSAEAEEVYQAILAMMKGRLCGLETGLQEATDAYTTLETKCHRLGQENIALLRALMACVGASGHPCAADPKKYNGCNHAGADHFIQQVNVAAQFYTFDNEVQKILWAQSFLTGQALEWSGSVTRDTDPATKDSHTQWDAWSKKFTTVYGSRDAAGDAMQRLMTISQGSCTITAYTTKFRDLIAKLPATDRSSLFVKTRYWGGLTLVSKEQLVGTNYATVEEAMQVLLACEAKLKDIAEEQRRQRGGGESNTPNSATSLAPRAPATPALQPRATQTQRAPAQAALPPANHGCWNDA